jgi:hypothetical protein
MRQFPDNAGRMTSAPVYGGSRGTFRSVAQRESQHRTLVRGHGLRWQVDCKAAAWIAVQHRLEHLHLQRASEDDLPGLLVETTAAIAEIGDERHVAVGSVSARNCLAMYGILET